MKIKKKMIMTHTHHKKRSHNQKYHHNNLVQIIIQIINIQVMSMINLNQITHRHIQIKNL